MMKSGHWLVVVGLAAVGGYLLGEGRVLTGGNGGIVDRRSGEAARVSVSQKVGQREGKGRPRGAARKAGEEDPELLLLRLLAQQREGISGDPFGDDIGLTSDRLTAAIFQLPESAFPTVLDHCWEATEDEWDPFSEGRPGWEWNLLTQMLARWTDLAPEAAMAWVDEQGGEEDGMRDYQMIVAQEALRRHPEVAIRMIEDLLARWNPPEVLAAPSDFPSGDPFAEEGGEGDRPEFAGANADDFFLLLCQQHPDRALEAFMNASEALRYDGYYSWARGMVGVDRFTEAMSYAESLPGELGEQVREALVDEYAELRPKEFAALLEAGGAEFGRERDGVAMRLMAEEDHAQASEWYLSRAQGTQERARRVADLITELPMGEAVAWLTAQEQKGEPVGVAWTRLVGSATPEAAYPLLGKVPEGARETVMKKLFEKGAAATTVDFGRIEATYFEPNPDAMALVEEHGLRAQYEQYLAARNAEVTAKTLEFLEERGLVEVGVDSE